MKATVVILNARRGMVAAETKDGEYVIFQLLESYDLELGDQIRHNDFYSMGGEIYLNLTKDERMHVYVQNVCESLDQAGKQCFYNGAFSDSAI